MSAETWISLIVGGLGFVVGVYGLIIARNARQEAQLANDIASDSNFKAAEANTISRESNAIAEQALQVSKDHGGEQLALYRQELELTMERESRQLMADLAKEAERTKAEAERDRLRVLREEHNRDLNRARFDVTPDQRNSRGRLRIRIVNRGPSAARDIVATLAIGGRTLQLGSTSALVQNGQMPVFAELSAIAGTYDTGPDNTEVVHPAISGDFTLTYTDGNGPQTLYKLLNIGPGSRFDQRKFTIADA
jgi:hypothetical protein